jgi:hypothetical protein
MEWCFHQRAGTSGSPGQVDHGVETMFMAGLYSGTLNAGIVNAHDISQERITADVIGT